MDVSGTAGEVVEVMVMDMNGHRMASFENTARFSVAAFPAGSYIVRVRSRHDDSETVDYLKLVKK